MAEKRIIAVIGATGAQGGGLVRAITGDAGSDFAVRAITRNPDSDKAKALAGQGIEVVKADLDDVDSLRKAFDGAYGAFCVTNFWEHFSPQKETMQAGNMAAAAKDTGLKHVIWSTFEDPREKVPLDDDRMPTLMEKHKVPHFESKAEANRFFAEAGVPTTYLLTSFYWENMIYFGTGPQKGEDGSYSLVMPMGDKKLPGIASGDIGKCAYGILKKPGDFIGKTVGISGDQTTGNEMAAALTTALGVEIGYYDVPADVYRGFDFPGAQDMGNMFQYKRDFNEDYCGARSVEFSKTLNPSLQSFESWLAENKTKIPLG